jgi:hypothetical protein
VRLTRRGAAAGAASAFAALFGWSLCRRGIVLSDEGFLLVQALEMAQGKVPYRDLDAFVAPGVWFLLSALFRIVEPSVLASRVLALACWCGSLATVVRIVSRLASPAAATGAFAGFLVMSVWAFPAWTWSFYSPWSVLFGLVAFERVLAWRSARRPSELVGVGLALGLAFLFKQNYGALAALGCAFGIGSALLESRQPGAARLRDGLAALRPLAIGVALVAVPTLAYFGAHGALGDAFEALVVHPFRGFLGTHDIAYLGLGELWTREQMPGIGRYTYGAHAFSATALRFDWPDPLLRAVEILHVLLYWIPPLLFGTAAWLALGPALRGRPPDGGLLALLAFAGLLYLGVFPRADFNHLMNVYQPVVALGAVVAARLLGRRAAPAGARRRALVASAAVLLGAYALVASAAVLLGAYALVAGYWAVDLLRSLDTAVAGPRGGVLVSRVEQEMLAFEVAAIRAETRAGEPVLTLPGLAMLNFLAERPLPSRYTNLYAVHIAHDRGAGVVEGSEQSGVRLVVADYDDFFSERSRLRDYAPLLTDYLRRSFAPIFSVAIDEHLFLRRRPSPLPARETQGALAECDAATRKEGRRSLQQHLLFDILYHRLETDSVDISDDVSTLCRVEVPGPSELRFRVGYRQPVEVRAGSDLVAEIWVQRRGHADELLYREGLPLAPVRGWRSPPARERTLDLSRFAGEELWLIFRTRFRGEVRMNLLDFTGFAMVWQDPRIERSTP